MLTSFFRLIRTNDCSALPVFFPGTMASADFSQFVVTTHFFRIRLLNAPERPPRVRTKSFASSTCRIYVHRFRVAIGLQPLWRPHPRCPPDAISVRQVKGLLTASFRFHLTMDTLAVQLCASRHRVRSGLSPVRLRPCRAHHKTRKHYFSASGFLYYDIEIRICTF